MNRNGYVSLVLFACVFAHPIARADEMIQPFSSCSEVERIERGKSHNIVRSEESVVAVRSTFRDFPASLMYMCGEAFWAKDVTYGDFVRDDAEQEFEALRKAYSEQYGIPCVDSERWPLWKKVLMYFQLGGHYESMTPYAYWYTSDAFIHVFIDRAPKNSEEENVIDYKNEWVIGVSTNYGTHSHAVSAQSGSATTEPASNECESYDDAENAEK